MHVLLVRHAEALPGEPDELRPLSPAGRAHARSLGVELAGRKPSAVLSSPLLRARETAEAIAKATGAKVRIEPLLAPGAAAAELRDAVLAQGETVVAVGHQPDLSEIVLELTGERVSFAPGSLHEVEL